MPGLILGFFILTFLFLGLFFIPYQRIGAWLSRFFHLKSFFGGIALIVFGLVAKAVTGEETTAPTTNKMGAILHSYSTAYWQLALVLGCIFIIASIFLNRWFKNGE
ncbi:hypothetical protein ACN5L9_004139 [Cronobacter sakazakii]|uniref:hypothetical protein n=1 Tax=Enterobacter cloacae complex TaxID=354276 RepID=UPI0012DE694B|nr:MULTISPECIES: hypothetical protein [Enterobacter cloacae complex]KAB1466691.1 hypothetical protein FZI46_21000 [Cronobacter sakazakii]HCN0848003.1 hypothetical protein [Escherichia coli]MCK7033326.1 hypothetical protein [Enterobacter kobei]MCZ9583158.1 hypothetical protein [Enterobacter cloacae]HAS1225385.1 hypothetical protein [Enterobacter cloacae]